MTDGVTATPWTRASWRAALAQGLADLHKAKSTSRALSDAFMLNGLPKPKVRAGDRVDFTIPEEPETTKVGAGLTLADLTPAARAARDTELLHQERVSTYRYFRNAQMHGRETFDPDQLAEVMTRLELPAPESMTDFAATVWITPDKQVRVRNKVKGDMTAKELVSRLETAGVNEPPETALLRQAFGEQLISPQDKVTSPRVTPEVKWLTSKVGNPLEDQIPKITLTA